MTYLDNCRTSSNCIIGDVGVATSEDNVRLARKSFGDGHRVAAIDRGSRDKGRTCHGDKCGVHLLTVGALQDIVLRILVRTLQQGV